jgi:hypothetical protein
LLSQKVPAADAIITKEAAANLSRRFLRRLFTGDISICLPSSSALLIIREMVLRATSLSWPG